MESFFGNLQFVLETAPELREETTRIMSSECSMLDGSREMND